MKKSFNEELKSEEGQINRDIVGIEEKIQNNKKVRYLVYGAVVVALGALFGILAGTGAI